MTNTSSLLPVRRTVGIGMSRARPIPGEGPPPAASPADDVTDEEDSLAASTPPAPPSSNVLACHPWEGLPTLVVPTLQLARL